MSNQKQIISLYFYTYKVIFASYTIYKLTVFDRPGSLMIYLQTCNCYIYNVQSQKRICTKVEKNIGAMQVKLRSLRRKLPTRILFLLRNINVAFQIMFQSSNHTLLHWQLKTLTLLKFSSTIQSQHRILLKTLQHCRHFVTHQITPGCEDIPSLHSVASCTTCHRPIFYSYDLIFISLTSNHLYRGINSRAFSNLSRQCSLSPAFRPFYL